VETIATSGAGLPAGVDFSPKSDILYVGANIGTKVEAFAFPAGRPLAGSPYTYSTGSDSSTVLASKDGQCLFVANQFSSGVTSIPLSGGVPGATANFFPAGSGGFPTGMANDITGKMFYVGSEPDNTVTTEIIGSGCGLTESPGGPVGTGTPRLQSLPASLAASP
jgi:6-phosphogluconolactonase (cycloisomerase 2 family)